MCFAFINIIANINTIIRYVKIIINIETFISYGIKKKKINIQQTQITLIFNKNQIIKLIIKIESAINILTSRRACSIFFSGTNARLNKC